MSSPSFADTERAGERPARRVALLGSTGSIGRQAVDVLAAHPDASRSSRWPPAPTPRCSPSRPHACSRWPSRSATRRRWRRWTSRPGRHASVVRRARGARDARRRRSRRSSRPAASSACVPCSPRCGAGKVVATANKETLVAGGHLVMPLARGLAATRRGDRPARPVRQPARLAPPDRLGALGDLAVPRRRGDGRRSRA